MHEVGHEAQPASSIWHGSTFQYSVAQHLLQVDQAACTAHPLAAHLSLAKRKLTVKVESQPNNEASFHEFAVFNHV
eukprot:5640722-Amphidinium_carterae.1